MDNWASTKEPLYVLCSAGHEICNRTYQHDCRLRLPPRRVVLQLTLSGSGFHRRGGRRGLLTPGLAFLDLLPGDWSYGYAPESHGPYEQVFVAFLGEPSFQVAEQIIARFGNVLDFGLDSPLVAPMRRLARQFERNEHADRYLTSARIYELCMLLLSQLGRQRSSACPITAGSLQLIHERAADPTLNVAVMAAALGCSRSHLTRRFQAATASTPLEYLLQYRLDLAAKALQNNNQPIVEVAVKHGFASSNYFCRVFRQRFGITPKRHRLAFRT